MTTITVVPDPNAYSGPWEAILADESGYTYSSVSEAADHLGPNNEMTISVRRGSALPVDEYGDDPKLSGEWRSGDCIFELDVYLGDDGDPSTICATRYAQAQAMADGLNQAAAKAGAR